MVDAKGNEVEYTGPARSEKWVTTFDSENRELETQVFRDGRIATSYRYAYESNSFGNWIVKHESIWMANFPRSGYQLSSIYRRRFQYFSE